MADLSDTQFLPEVWALYGIGVAVITLRFATRIKTVGFKGFQGDDYFSILTLAFFTVDAATVHIIFGAGTNVEASALLATKKLTNQEIATFEFGSKQQLAAWYSYTALIWTMKATMLFFFHRLTIGLWQHKYIKPIAIVCGVSYLGVVSTVTFGCFPTKRNWQVVPDPGQHCTLKLQNFLVTVVLNVITDALILAIPVPLLWTLRVPLHRKIIISLLLCSGLFVIAAAIIRVALTLGRNPSATNINRWGVRETIVGIVTINAPILRPMFTHGFWTGGMWNGGSAGTGEAAYIRSTGGTGGLGGGRSRGFELHSGSGKSNPKIKSDKKLNLGWNTKSSTLASSSRTMKDLESGVVGGGHKRGKSSATLVSRSVESLQYIIHGGSEPGKRGSTAGSRRGSEMGDLQRQESNNKPPLQVKVMTSFKIETEMADGSKVVESVRRGELQKEREEEWERNDGFGLGRI